MPRRAQADPDAEGGEEMEEAPGPEAEDSGSDGFDAMLELFGDGGPEDLLASMFPREDDAVPEAVVEPADDVPPAAAPLSLLDRVLESTAYGIFTIVPKQPTDKLRFGGFQARCVLHRSGQTLGKLK